MAKTIPEVRDAINALRVKLTNLEEQRTAIDKQIEQVNDAIAALTGISTGYSGGSGNKPPIHRKSRKEVRVVEEQILKFLSNLQAGDTFTVHDLGQAIKQYDYHFFSEHLRRFADSYAVERTKRKVKSQGHGLSKPSYTYLWRFKG